ncbi:hypothetical protein KC19_10G165800 [Ceratodon purpureus]|uniref:Complex 1 LYR protein domain-containing protein n=1 Tax=Ceratodon purpureus TaxID=3225 RepID=A0A8T0GP46_CERPU|nr:hypothetical protein KC19_10G165800 [Ceratodon purpureus]
MAGARSAEALSIFRALLRTRKQCFAGDPEMLVAAAKQIRDDFDEHRNVGPGEELDKLMTKAREAIKFMKANIIQAKQNDRGNYEVKLKPEHQGASIEEVIP